MFAHPPPLFASPSPLRLGGIPTLSQPTSLFRRAGQWRPAFEMLMMDFEGQKSCDGQSSPSSGAPAASVEPASAPTETATADSSISAATSASTPPTLPHQKGSSFLSSHNTSTLLTSSELAPSATLAPRTSPNLTLPAPSNPPAPFNVTVNFNFSHPRDSKSTFTASNAASSAFPTTRSRESKYLSLARRFPTAQPLEQSRARRAAVYTQNVKERSSERRFERQAETAMHRAFIDDRRDWAAAQLRLAAECEIDPADVDFDAAVDVDAEFALSGQPESSDLEPWSQMSGIDAVAPAYDLPPVDRENAELAYLAQLDETAGIYDDLDMAGGKAAGYASSDLFEDDARDIELELLEAMERVEAMDLT